MSLPPLDDERALRALVLDYAGHLDRRRPDAVADLFEPDATWRMVWRDGRTPPAVSSGRRQITAVVRGLDRFASTLHIVANHVVHVDGDEGGGEVYCTAHHLQVDDAGAVDHVLYIRYTDRYRRRDGRWRFAERETCVEWSATHPST